MDEVLGWTFVKITVATIDVLRALARDLELDQARTASRGHEWWRRAVPKEGGMLVVTAGLHCECSSVADGHVAAEDVLARAERK